MNEFRTDRHSKSLTAYGDPYFPFAYFWDNLEQYKNGVIDWHWHDEIEFVYVLSDRVICQVAADQFVLNKGEGLFINTNVLHRFTTTGKGNMASIIFSPHFIAGPQSRIYSLFVLPVISSSTFSYVFSNKALWEEQILRQLEDIIAALRTDDPRQDLRLTVMVMQLWQVFFDHFPGNASTRGNLAKIQERVQKMMNFIEENFSHNITAEDIANAASISQSEARRCFAKMIHISPNQYLTHYRLTQAAKLLVTTDHTVQEIADIIGFSSPSYFNRMFKSQYQVSPLKMRKNI